ncbi:uncharacterized protein LOC133723062 [Rosa rugosa]|uniref:uncharacterized protein LOC133723062 n=1 Tax=Rosa rugosa TaxID=74645 RepID=UPI002B40BAE9|nr:uncharacterized protein LOC133723062 [Rosa rugosa]
MERSNPSRCVQRMRGSRGCGGSSGVGAAKANCRGSSCSGSSRAGRRGALAGLVVSVYAEGFLRQKLSGQGLAFIIAGGSVVQKNLEVGKVLSVDVSCIAVVTSYNSQRPNQIQWAMRRAVFGITEILKLVRRLYRLILDSAKERENIDGRTVFCFFWHIIFTCSSSSYFCQ